MPAKALFGYGGCLVCAEALEHHRLFRCGSARRPRPQGTRRNANLAARIPRARPAQRHTHTGTLRAGTCAPAEQVSDEADAVFIASELAAAEISAPSRERLGILLEALEKALRESARTVALAAGGDTSSPPKRFCHLAALGEPVAVARVLLDDSAAKDAPPVQFALRAPGRAGDDFDVAVLTPPAEASPPPDAVQRRQLMCEHFLGFAPSVCAKQTRGAGVPAPSAPGCQIELADGSSVESVDVPAKDVGSGDPIGDLSPLRFALLSPPPEPVRLSCSSASPLLSISPSASIPARDIVEVRDTTTWKSEQVRQDTESTRAKQYALTPSIPRPVNARRVLPGAHRCACTVRIHRWRRRV